MTDEEMMIEEPEGSHGDVVKWAAAFFGLGLLVGGVIGLLLAPKSGKESREQLRAFASDITEKTRKFTKDMGQRAATTKDALSESIKAGKAKYDEIKQSDDK